MRIQLVLGADLDNNKLPEKMLATLSKELKKDGVVSLTDENPDVIHLIGAWTSSAVSLAKDASAKHIAFIHTPLGSLSPWHKPSSSHAKMTARCRAVVSSGNMEQELLNDGSIANLRMILDSTVTQKTSEQLMANEYKNIYENVIKTNDDALWEDVEHQVGLIKESDPVILNICKNLLYTRKLSERKNIPQIFLNQLADLLEKSDFDEDKLGEVLKFIRLYEFTQRLEYLMQETANLTEGFMPVPRKEDKTSKAMLRIITDYNKH